MAKMMAAMKIVFGSARTKIPFQWACQAMGPQRSASTQGMYLPAITPAETPRMGMTEMRVEPMKRPVR